MGALTASDTVVDKGLPSLCRSSIYYLPGHGGRLGTGLGEGLLSRGFDVAGRETVGEFKDLPFNEQVALVAQVEGKQGEMLEC